MKVFYRNARCALNRVRTNANKQYHVLPNKGQIKRQNVSTFHWRLYSRCTRGRYYWTGSQMTANESEMKNTSSYSISAARSRGRSGAPRGNASVPVISPPLMFGMQTQYEFEEAAAPMITASNPPTGTQTSGDGRWVTEWKESALTWTHLFWRCLRFKTGWRFSRWFFQSTRTASFSLWPLGASHKILSANPFVNISRTFVLSPCLASWEKFLMWLEATF